MTENRKKRTGIAIALCAIFLAILIVSVSVIASMQQRASETADTDGMKIEEISQNDVSLTVTEIALDDFEAYGVSPMAETAYTLTATVNAGATKKAVNWTAEFQDPTSEWATGKTVTDYVTVSPTGDLTATVSCMAAFGETILVSAVSRDDPVQKSTCTCEYQKKTVGAHIRINSNEEASTLFAIGDVTSEGGRFTESKLCFNSNYYFKVAPIYGEGTVEPTVNPQDTGCSVWLILNETAKEKLQEYGYTAGVTLEYTCKLQGYFQPSCPATTLDASALATLFGSNASDGSFYDAVVAAQNNGFHDFLDLHIRPGYDSEEFICTFDIETDSFYSPVSSVKLDEEKLRF